MADKRIDQDRVDPAGQVPEADLLEQQAPIDPALSGEPPSAHRDAPTKPVEEADRWEQQLPVPTPDDDYPHDRAEAG